MSMSELKKNAVQSEKDVTLYLSDFTRGIRKFWWLSIVFAVLCGGIMLYWAYVRTVPMYQTSATFTVLIPNETLSGNEDQAAYSFSYSRTTADRLAAAFQYASQSSILQKKVCQALEVSSMPAILTVTFAEGTNLMTITASGQEPQLVYEVLLSFVEHYGDVTTYIIGPTRLVTIEEPVIPTEPYNARSWQQVVIKAILLGLAIEAAWIALYAVLRQTVRTKADIRQELNQTCIGVLPQVTFKRHNRKMDTRVLLTNPGVSGDFLESLRLLRDAVQSGLQEDEKVLLLTSTAPAEGKSVIALNLAAILAKTGKKVLVLDADLRNSGVTSILRINGAKSAPEGGEDGPAPLYNIQNYAPLGIDVLTFDTRKNGLRHIIRSDRMQRVIDPLRAQYDLIIIDTPPCGMISDTAVIADAADAALYILRQDTVLISRIRNGINILLGTNARLIGCVLNGTTGGLGGYGYYYGSYRQSYSSTYPGRSTASHWAEKSR